MVEMLAYNAVAAFETVQVAVDFNKLSGKRSTV
jgi:hypothetical protein